MLNISSEFKKVLEHYPELIDLIEQNKIKEFYDILYGDNPKYVHGNNYLLKPMYISDAYKILTELGINPLQYFSTLSEMMVGYINVDKLIIPANIDTIKEYSIYNSTIKQIIILNDIITIDTAAIFKCKVGEFVCNADRITLTGLGAYRTFFNTISNYRENTKFTFKENCNIYINGFGWSYIKYIIKNYGLNQKYNIELM